MKSTPRDFKNMTDKVSTLLSQYLTEAQAGKGKVLQQKEYSELASILNLERLVKEGGLNPDSVDDWLNTYLDNTQHMHHPNYMGHQVAVPHVASGIADFIHGVINNPMAIYEMGPAASIIEQVIINWMLSKISWFDRDSLQDLPSQSAGVLTHGGSLANLTALLAARARISPRAWDEGHTGDLIVLGSDVAHYSILRSISIMGMGKQAFYKVRTDQNEVLLVEDLKKTYRTVKDEGKQVMAVIANACATSTGLYDPLEEIGHFCKENNLWFHVDGAHGASALLSDEYKYLMRGAELADSMIWDTHKMLRTSTLSAAVLFRNKEDMSNAFSQKGSYLFHEKEEPGFDLMPYTVECTKAGLGTKLFWVLAAEGEKGLNDFVTERFALTKWFFDYLQNDDDFNCPYEPESNILCFQYLPKSSSNAMQLHLRNEIVKKGNYYISSTEVTGIRYLRVVVINPLTDKTHLEGLVQEIKQIAKEVL